MNTVRSTGGSSYYRAPIAPPSVPSEYLSRHELGIYSSRKELSLNDSAGIYGTSASYRRSSQQQNEYSGFDTLDRRNATALMQQLSSGHQSVGPFVGREINSLRTNLENVDYGTHGLVSNHAQLNPNQIYNRSNSDSSNQPVGLKMGQLKTDSERRTSNMSQRSNKSNASQYYESPSNHRHQATYEDGNIYADPAVENHDVIPNWVPIDRCIEKVITTYDYEGLREDELTFKENTYIYVIKKNDDHWYEGVLQDETGHIHTGLYPYNYAKCIRKYQSDHSEC